MWLQLTLPGVFSSSDYELAFFFHFGLFPRPQLYYRQFEASDVLKLIGVITTGNILPRIDDIALGCSVLYISGNSICHHNCAHYLPAMRNYVRSVRPHLLESSGSSMSYLAAFFLDCADHWIFIPVSCELALVLVV